VDAHIRDLWSMRVKGATG